MREIMTRSVLAMLALGVLLVSRGPAQETTPEDEQVEQIRVRRDIGAGDQARIAQWVEMQIEKLAERAAQDPSAALKQFRDRCATLYDKQGNSSAFRTELTGQTARAAIPRFTDAEVSGVVSRSLATVLVDLDRVETLDALVAGLEAKDASTRFLCAVGLARLKGEIEADRTRLDRVIQALREAGLAESDPVVLSRIYLALAYPNQVPAVIGVYLELFDKRLSSRRGPALVADRAEVDAFEFLRSRAVLQTLSPNQKTELASKLAVFMRLDAERYNVDKLDHYEVAALERRLDGIEDILSTLVGGNAGGNIRAELERGGRKRRAEVRRQAYLWIGNPETNQSGALNEAPWNVPRGAP